MKRIITMAIAALLFTSVQAETEYQTIGGYQSLEEAMPAIFYALPSQYGYKEYSPSTGMLKPPTRKYNDFGLVQKRVDFSFSFENGEIKMFYSDHQMEDKTKGEWEDCPSKLTKKDKSFFDEFATALKNYNSDVSFKKEVDAKFYSNAKLLLQLMKDHKQIAFDLWSNNSSGLQGDFSYLMFLNAVDNSDDGYSGYQYKVDLELLEVTTEKVPLKIVMYANLKSKSNPDGMHKDIPKLNKKENYWFANLKAEIESFSKQSDGTYLMVLKDLS